MNIDLAKDRMVSHSVINYLNASYQGWFAGLNVLAQLQHDAFSDELIAEVQHALSRINTWNVQLYEDDCLLSASWLTAESFEAQHALDLLDKLKPGLNGLAAEVERILQLAQTPSDTDIKMLLSAVARHVYARDIYIRGFSEYGSRFGLPQMVEKYQELLAGAAHGLQSLHLLVSSFKRAEMSSAKVDPAFLFNLRLSAQILPAVFRTHVHDVNQLLSPFRGGLTFANADFGKSEGDLWKNNGFGPVPAGYWRAYGFSPEEAREWSELRMNDAALVSEWKRFGFNPATAAPWFLEEFAPHAAAAWARAGHSPASAGEQIAKGATQPGQPPSQENKRS